MVFTRICMSTLRRCRWEYKHALCHLRTICKLCWFKGIQRDTWAQCGWFLFLNYVREPCGRFVCLFHCIVMANSSPLLINAEDFSYYKIFKPSIIKKMEFISNSGKFSTSVRTVYAILTCFVVCSALVRGKLAY